MVNSTAPPASSAERTSSVRIVSRPPPSVASLALIARFRIAASNCAGSSLHGQPPSPSSSRSSIVSPIARWISDAKSVIAALMSTIRASSGSCRDNSSNCRVSCAPRAKTALRRLDQPPQPVARHLGLGRGPRHAVEQVEIAADDRQQVVEIVRHPAGEPADGFHLLALPQRLFGPFALGDLGAQLAVGRVEIAGAAFEFVIRSGQRRVRRAEHDHQQRGHRHQQPDAEIALQPMRDRLGQEVEIDAAELGVVLHHRHRHDQAVAVE